MTLNCQTRSDFKSSRNMLNWSKEINVIPVEKMRALI